MTQRIFVPCTLETAIADQKNQLGYATTSRKLSTSQDGAALSE
jgi:hypothetical protein